jgi:hypothetical protein
MSTARRTRGQFSSLLLSLLLFDFSRDVDAFIDSLTRTIEFFTDIDAPNGDGSEAFVPFV